jgi:multidrug resistance efflux pump
MKLVINKKTILPIIVLIIGVSLEAHYLWTTKKSHQPKPSTNTPSFVASTTTQPAVIVSASSASSSSVIETSAVAQAAEKIQLSPQVTGRLAKLYVEEGDKVKSGQLVAQLEQDPTLLAALDNARTNLTSTIAAANKSIETAEVAVSAAQTNLDNTKISANQSVQQAELAVRSAEIALNQAKQNKENSTTNTQQAVKDAYEQSLVTMHSGLANILSALTTVGDIIGQAPGNTEANNIYEDVLGAKNQQTLINTKNLFDQTKISYQQAKANYDSLNSASSFSQIDKAIEEVGQALGLAQKTLTQARLMLDNTPTKIGFNAEALGGLKTLVDTQLVGINQSLNALVANKQAIARAKLTTTSTDDNTESALRQAQNNLDLAKQNLALAKTQAQAQIEAAEKQLEQAQANLASAKKRAQQQIDAARAQVNSVLARVENTKIKAPVSGLVSKVYFETGEMVMAGRPLVDIINTSAIKFEIGLSEEQVGKVRVGQAAEVVIESLDNKTFLGQVYYVAEAADPVSKKFKAKILVDNKDKEIKDGMIGQIIIKS